MRAANETCRAFVRDYLDRRSAPKGVLRYAVDTMLAQRWALARWFNGMANQVESEVREALGITSARSAMPGFRWPCWPKSPVRSNPASTHSRGATAGSTARSERTDRR